MKSLLRSFSFALTLIPLAMITAPANAEDVPKVVRISWFGSAGPWVLAKADNAFDENFGTEVKWSQYGSGGDVLTALAADQVDISLLGSPPTVGGLIRGLPIQIIALE